MITAHPTPLHVVGDEDSSKRRQILDGARKVFMDLGFDGASMGEIARSAGVSKGTLYVYFDDKNRLFEAIVEEEALEQGKVAFNFDPERDVTTTLMEFGQAYIQLLCRPGGGSATRTVMAIAERMPEVGRRFYNNVIALTIARRPRLRRSGSRRWSKARPGYSSRAIRRNLADRCRSAGAEKAISVPPAHGQVRFP